MKAHDDNGEVEVDAMDVDDNDTFGEDGVGSEGADKGGRDDFDNEEKSRGDEDGNVDLSVDRNGADE